uniref:Uncharacterized protein n=1 Tax=uncultured marine virus TaxID=186617 RepID=A0A0F7L7S8_9VIRU|nr:hypothetical protein [uncultured marine virus]
MPALVTYSKRDTRLEGDAQAFPALITLGQLFVVGLQTDVALCSKSCHLFVLGLGKPPCVGLQIGCGDLDGQGV